MMVITREVKLSDELTVIVKELTVAEVRAWLNESPEKAEDRDFDLLTDLMNFDGIGMEEIHRFTDLQKDAVENLPPSAIAKVASVIKELNAVFFNQYLPALNKLRERLDQSATPAVAVSNAP
jgi:hypothetical protein